MARHRRDDQQLGIAVASFANEMLQLSKGFAQNDLFGDGNVLAIDDRVIQIERRLTTRGRRMGEHLKRGGKHWSTAHISNRI